MAGVVRRDAVKCGEAQRELMKTHTITLDNPGDCLIWREGMGRTVEIFDIRVASERRCGRGRELLERLLQIVNPQDDCVRGDRPAVIYAFTRMSNTVAHQFYEACGFRILGRLHEFYRDGGGVHEAALVYGLDL